MKCEWNVAGGEGLGRQGRTMPNWWIEALDILEGLKCCWSLSTTRRELKNRMEFDAIIGKCPGQAYGSDNRVPEIECWTKSLEQRRSRRWGHWKDLMCGYRNYLESSGMPGWLHQLSVQLLILVQVMISRFVSGAPHQSLHWQRGACLGFSLCLSPVCVHMCVHSLSLSGSLKNK